MEEKTFADIDEYIALFPSDIQDRLRAVRSAIREAAPDAAISYRMPTFHQNGNVVHFAAFKNHIGFFPGASGVEAFAGRLTAVQNVQRRHPISSQPAAAAGTGKRDRAIPHRGKRADLYR